jgi:hypothetical protein
MNNYYIYQHRKADTNEIFYVGKGSKNRLNNTICRSNFWKNIVKKHGFTAEILFDNLTEELAYLAEQEVIDRYKWLGIRLCNLSAGGMGGTGVVKSKETIEKLRKANIGKKLSDEHKKKISESNKGNKCALGYKRTEAEKKAISERAKLQKPSEETRKKMSEAAKKRVGRFVSQETKDKIRNSLLGKKQPEEVKLKISNTKKGIKNV